MLSICLLGETFVWKYDLVATILVIVGSILTILQMNIREDLVYDREKVWALILTWKAFYLLLMIIVKSILTVIAYCQLKSQVNGCKADIEKFLVAWK